MFFRNKPTSPPPRPAAPTPAIDPRDQVWNRIACALERIAFAQECAAGVRTPSCCCASSAAAVGDAAPPGALQPGGD